MVKPPEEIAKSRALEGRRTDLHEHGLIHNLAPKSHRLGPGPAPAGRKGGDIPGGFTAG